MTSVRASKLVARPPDGGSDNARAKARRVSLDMMDYYAVDDESDAPGQNQGRQRKLGGGAMGNNRAGGSSAAPSSRVADDMRTTDGCDSDLACERANEAQRRHLASSAQGATIKCSATNKLPPSISEREEDQASGDLNLPGDKAAARDHLSIESTTSNNSKRKNRSLRNKKFNSLILSEEDRKVPAAVITSSHKVKGAEIYPANSSRERSSSITSDYFSSNHNSPIVNNKKQESKSLAKSLTLDIHSQKNRKRIVETRNKRSTTIYENPIFCSQQDALQIDLNRGSLAAMEPNLHQSEATTTADRVSAQLIVAKRPNSATKQRQTSVAAAAATNNRNSDYSATAKSRPAAVAYERDESLYESKPSSSASSSSLSLHESALAADNKQRLGIIDDDDDGLDRKASLAWPPPSSSSASSSSASSSLPRRRLIMIDQQSASADRSAPASKFNDTRASSNNKNNSTARGAHLSEKQNALIRPSQPANFETKSGQIQYHRQEFNASVTGASLLHYTPAESNRQRDSSSLLNGGGRNLSCQAMEQSSHYYYAPPAAARRDEMPAPSNSYSMAYGQQANCLGANSNNSDSDHYYQQVIVPSQQQQPTTSSSTSTDTHSSLNHQLMSQHHSSTSRNQPLGQQGSSPCRSIQRIVSSLFSHGNQQHQHHPLPPIPTINQNLVSCEPLISSTNTLIDLKRQQLHQFNHFQQPQQQQQRQESKAIELANISQCDPQKQQHYYYGVNTLKSPSPQIAHYKSHDLNHSFHTLVDKMQTNRNFYQIQSSPSTNQIYQNSQMGPHLVSHGGQYRAGSGSSSCCSDSGAFRLPAIVDERLRRKRRAKFIDFCSTKLCLALFLLSALACFVLLTLMYLYSSSNRHQLIMSSSFGSGDDGRAPANNYQQIIGANTRDSLLKPPFELPPDQSYQQKAPPIMGPNNLLQPNINKPQFNVIQPTTTTTTTTPAEPVAARPKIVVENGFLLTSLRQNYWAKFRGVDYDRATINQCSAASDNDPSSPSYWCNFKGFCDSETGSCACLAGFSGPSCAMVNCPNECSNHGECKLRQDSTLNVLGAGSRLDLKADTVRSKSHLESISFQSLHSDRYQNSLCPRRLDQSLQENEFNNSWAVSLRHQAAAFDSRLDWQCVCEPGYAGPDCSQLKETDCSNGNDDDNDGLVDCEDDDCCSQAICRENLMCFKSPEPIKVLSNKTLFGPGLRTLSTDSAGGRSFEFFEQVKFLIANESVVSYAKEKAFDKARVAVIRGKVVKATRSSAADMSATDFAESHRQGLVSLRVGVVENAQFGFTLTRDDGCFDLIVNGNEWVTLLFMSNNYIPVKRKVFVRANAINVLDDEIEMQLGSLSGGSPSSATSQSEKELKSASSSTSSFNLQLNSELYKLASSLAKQQEDEKKRNSIYDCLFRNVNSPDRSQFQYLYEPILVENQNFNDTNGINYSRDLLKSFALATSGSFSSQLGDKLTINYNSAHFSPSSSVVKSTISIRLLPDNFFHDEKQQGKLKSVVVQLNIDGQSRREKLTPIAGLNYQFAWNRRNIYNRKIYGFSELDLKVGYEYESKMNRSFGLILKDCVNQYLDLSGQELQQHLDRTKLLHLVNNDYLFERQTIWFERKLFIEGHQLNHHSDIGRWTLGSSNRLDLSNEIVYFGSGWSLPYKLIYPPVVGEPIKLNLVGKSATTTRGDNSGPLAGGHAAGKIMTRGPNSSVFLIYQSKNGANQQSPSFEAQNRENRLIQLDSSGKRRLLDLPLASLTGKFYQQFKVTKRGGGGGAHSNAPRADLFEDNNGPDDNPADSDDIQLIYNNYLSTLYLSSRRAAKIVQVSYASLMVLNKTLAGPPTGGTLALEDEIDIEPLCGFGHQYLSLSAPADSIKPIRASRLLGPHSLTLDEDRQVLYFIDGLSHLMALNLNSNHLAFVTSAPSSSYTNGKSSSSACGPSDLKLANFRDYKPIKMHSLAWSKSDSSLYFVDRNSIFALRQDFSLDLIALAAIGQQSEQLSVLFARVFEKNCFRDQTDQLADQLGLIRSILVDEGDSNLLIVHQWNSMKSNSNKIYGRLYLAKVKLGLRSSSDSFPLKVIDLHSAESAYDPMIWKMFFEAGQQQQTNKKINWIELARKYNEFSSSQLASRGSAAIPFLHLSSGFKSLDAIEINADGSIVVLDFNSDSIKLLAPYSLANDDGANFNLNERHDVNINSRLFVQTKSGANRIQSSSPSSFVNDVANINDFDESRKLRVLMLQNPITRDLMEFHSSSGLQLSLISSSLDTGSSISTKSEFYYQILYYTNARPRTTVNKLSSFDQDSDYVEQQRLLSSNNGDGDDDNEDDENDSDVRELIQRSPIDRSKYDGKSKNPIVRLSKIIDSKGREFEFIRSFIGNKYVIKNVLLNREIFYETRTENHKGLLITLYQPGMDYYMELIYNSLTYLIRDILIKLELTKAQQQRTSADPTQYGKPRAQFSKLHDNMYQFNSNMGQELNKDLLQVRRIVYDRVFNHYCNLFIVNA